MEPEPSWRGCLGMTKQNLIIRPGLTAIAAFAALGTTPLLAQVADPLAATSDSAPIVAPTPVVAAPDLSAVPTADPLAPAAKAKPTATKATVAKTSRPAARPVTKTVVRTVASVAAVTPAAPAVPEAPVAAAPAPLPVEAPVAAAPAPVAQTASGLPADALPIGAAGLGALALAGAALAMRRRKRRLADEEFVTTYNEPAFAAPAPMMAAPEPMMAAPEPVIPERAPMVAAKPIKAWGSTAPAATATVGDGEVPEGIDPDSHVATAYRGPTAENPSLSLKTRLKRAAFFDQRERQAAAGEAAPLDMTAGLPEAALETA